MIWLQLQLTQKDANIGLSRLRLSRTIMIVDGFFDGSDIHRKPHIEALASRFFVSDTPIRCDYGAAPVIQFNEHHYGNSDISPSPWLKGDIELIEAALGVGFF